MSGFPNKLKDSNNKRNPKTCNKYLKEGETSLLGLTRVKNIRKGKIHM
jgi:hypothetical protein